MAGLFRKYNALLIRKPLITQCATAAVLFGTGDVIAQQAIERKGGNHDITRTARLTLYGGIGFGPVMTYWYQFLGRIHVKSPLRGIFIKVWLDQAVLTPVAVAAFFASMALLEGKPKEIAPRIEEKYRKTVVMSWGVFIPAQLVNFWLVPAHLRFGFVGVVSLLWNTYLSSVNASAKEHVPEPKVIQAIEHKILPPGV